MRRCRASTSPATSTTSRHSGATTTSVFLPSRGGEGMPKSLLEAASCGRPILTTQVPGCEDLALRTGGWLVPAEDAEAAADAIVEIAARRDLEALGLRARAVIEAAYSEAKLWEVAEKYYFG
jgi:glycosyltransferase involved in cell wall biosynthesis